MVTTSRKEDTVAIKFYHGMISFGQWFNETEECKKVKKARFEDCTLCEIPKIIVLKLSELEDVSLISCNFKENSSYHGAEIVSGENVEDTFTSLKHFANLRKLFVHANLSHYPEAISTLTQLKELSLVANAITTLPESIGQLTNLQILNLSYCKLNSFPEVVTKLTALQSLNMEGNMIRTVPKSIKKKLEKSTSAKSVPLWVKILP